MKIETKKINELHPADYNPRIELMEEDKEYQKLKRSIQEFGYVEPIIFNERTNHIVGGHQRFNVLKDLGYEEIPVILIDMDGDKEKALNVALNKIEGDWDELKLKELFDELAESDIDMDLTGFDEEELEELMNSIPNFDEEASEEDNGDLSVIDKEPIICPHCGETIEP